MSSGIYNKYTGYHNRRSIRLQGYDYSQPGYYYVTICIHNMKQNMFGDVIGMEFVGNEFAKIVRACWDDLPNHYDTIALDEFVIMPNHVHFIIVIRGLHGGSTVGAGLKPAPTTKPALPEYVRAFKTFSSRRINETGTTFKWQRNYYEHIIRDEKSLYYIRNYIRENPIRWNNDIQGHIDKELLDPL